MPGIHITALVSHNDHPLGTYEPSIIPHVYSNVTILTTSLDQRPNEELTIHYDLVTLALLTLVYDPRPL